MGSNPWRGKRGREAEFRELHLAKLTLELFHEMSFVEKRFPVSADPLDQITGLGLGDVSLSR